MSKAMRNVMIRVITKRINNGETFDDVIVDYPKLTEDEIDDLRKTIVGK